MPLKLIEKTTSHHDEIIHGKSLNVRRSTFVVRSVFFPGIHAFAFLGNVLHTASAPNNYHNNNAKSSFQTVQLRQGIRNDNSHRIHGAILAGVAFLVERIPKSDTPNDPVVHRRG